MQKPVLVYHTTLQLEESNERMIIVERERRGTRSEAKQLSDFSFSFMVENAELPNRQFFF